MRKLIVVILVLMLAWSGYWFVGSSAAQRAISGWLDARAAQGWVANYSSVKTRGFPNRFDTTVSDLELADPRTGLAWTAPFFQILTLSYTPNHIIAAWPNTQTIASPYEKITVTSDRMIGSIVFQPKTALTLLRTSIELDNFGLVSDLGWSAQIEKGRFATRQTTARENAHDIYFEATTVRPSVAFRSRLDPAGLLPETIKTLKLDSTVGFDAPWDRFAIERRRPQVIALEVNDLTATWGKLDLRAAGKLTVSLDGELNGQIMVRARNWREMLTVAVDAGLVARTISGTLENALEFMAGTSGDPDMLEAPLKFRKGSLSFGPIPLGPAPRLKIR
jgi:hypothetical protein